LTQDPELIKRQLAGEDLQWSPEIELRDNISTDEITPVYVCYYFDDTLGEFPYLGLKAGDGFPITRGAVKNGISLLQFRANATAKGAAAGSPRLPR
jgi:3-isopropylmalate/(R)-2-methylmalate dehydratase large subunit